MSFIKASCVVNSTSTWWCHFTSDVNKNTIQHSIQETNSTFKQNIVNC